jgi:outer membrane receptor protein involved in Fe transport
MAPTNSTYTKANELGLRKEFEEDKSISQEFRLTFENNTIRSSFGYFFGKSEETRGYDFLLANPLDLYLPGFYAATSSAPFPPYANGVSETVLQTQYTDEGSTREATNHALFAELDWNVTSDTTALFGLRFENEKNKNTSSVTATNVNQADMLALGPRANPVFSAIKAGSDAGDPASQQFWSVLSAYMAAAQVDPDNLENDSLNKILNTLAAAGSNTSEKDNVNQVFLPKIGIRHQFSENIGAGYVMTQGYRSGGITLNPINTVKPTVEYDPEYVTNHEISFRSQWLEQQLTVNANAYYMKWEDQQVQVVGSNFYDRYISNAGSSTLKGLELDANYQGHNGLRLFANAGIAKTRYEDFTSGGKDYSGNQFQYSPEKTAAAGIGFDQGIGYSAYLISNHSGEMYLDNDNDRKLAAYTVTNLRLGYAADVWKINAYVNNLLDKRANAYEYSYDDYAPDPSFVLYSDYAYLVPKRSFGLVAQYDF